MEVPPIEMCIMTVECECGLESIPWNGPTINLACKDDQFETEYGSFRRFQLSYMRDVVTLENKNTVYVFEDGTVDSESKYCTPIYSKEYFVTQKDTEFFCHIKDRVISITYGDILRIISYDRWLSDLTVLADPEYVYICDVFTGRVYRSQHDAESLGPFDSCGSYHNANVMYSPYGLTWCGKLGSQLSIINCFGSTGFSQEIPFGEFLSSHQHPDNNGIGIIIKNKNGVELWGVIRYTFKFDVDIEKRAFVTPLYGQTDIIAHDATIKCLDGEIGVHKFVLALSSDILKYCLTDDRFAANSTISVRHPCHIVEIAVKIMYGLDVGYIKHDDILPLLLFADEWMVPIVFHTVLHNLTSDFLSLPFMPKDKYIDELFADLDPRPDLVNQIIDAVRNMPMENTGIKL